MKKTNFKKLQMHVLKSFNRAYVTRFQMEYTNIQRKKNTIKVNDISTFFILSMLNSP